MSFNKAIIKRFNEESSCAPPPTKYDPKTPHGSSAKDIHFGLYSGRKDEKPGMKDGFVTPLKPCRGRSTIIGTASSRSCSDSRIRKGSVSSKSSSTKSLHEIPGAVSIEELNEKEHCINEKILQIEALNNQLKEHQQMHNDMISSLEEEKQALSYQNAELSQKIEDLTTRYQRLEDELNGQKLEYEKLKNENEQKISELEETLKKQEQEQCSECLSAEARLLELQNVKNELEHQYQQLSNDILELKSKADVDAASIQALNMEILNEREKCVEIQSTFEDQKVEFTSKIEELEQQLQNASTSYSKLEQEYGLQKQEYISLKEGNELKIELLEDDCQRHEQMNGILSSEKQRLQSEIEEMKLKFVQKEELMAEFDLQIVGLKDQVQQIFAEKEEKEAALRSLEEELKSSKTQIVALEFSLGEEKRESSQTIEQLKQDLADMTSKQNGLLDELQTVTYKFDSLAEETNRYSETIASLTVELEDKTKNIFRLESYIETEKIKREQEIQGTEKIIADLQSANGELQVQYLSLDEELRRFKTQSEEDSSLLKILNVQLSEQQTTFTELQSRFQEEKHSLTQETEEIKQRLAEVQVLCQTREEECKTLKLQYELLETENEQNAKRFEQERKQNEERMDILKLRMETLQKETEHLRRQAATADSYRNELSKAKAENAMVKDKYQNARHQIEKDQDQIQSLTGMVSAYQQKEREISQKEQQREALEKKIHELMLENLALKENLEEYKSVYGDYANLASHQNNRQKIKHIVNMKEETIKLREENAKLRLQLSECKDRLRNAERQIGTGTRRFDPSQAFKQVLKEPHIQDDRDIRGPDSRSTFTVPKKTNPKPTVIVDSAKKQSKQGMAFDITFSENKEN